MTVTTGKPELAEAHLRGLIATVGLDVEYLRASGDTLYYRSPDGAEVAVLDLVGGYGTLVLGHNHPELVELAQRLLAADTPFHAQFSYHPYANDLASALNRIVRRELGAGEPFFAIFGNTGAEGVEISLKHAEMDRRIQAGELRTEIDGHVTQAETALRRGVAYVSPEVWTTLGTNCDTGDPARALREALEAHNNAAFDRPPVLLTLEDGFHGKLTGSVQLTHNPGYRLPFSALGLRVKFVPKKTGAVAEAADAERVVAFDPVLDAGKVRLVRRAVPVTGAMFVEPVQGEGGIHPLSPELAREIRQVADAHGFPVIADEVQSGMGRTGAFFASAHIGLEPDYLVLAKGIGGGIAKSSVVLIRGSRYRPDFELIHSSTFAKDAFSCLIGQKVVELLEANDGAAYRTAAERGARVRAELRAVADEFPDVITGVRGAGLMLGVEFADLSAAPAEVLAENARHGLIGYLFAGYLLHAHRLRVFPTASAPHTLRIEPSLHIDDASVNRIGTALRELAAILASGDPTPLFAWPQH